MTPENKTNKIFFSKWLEKKQFHVFNQIKEKLEKHNISFELLEKTEDYWLRDFMPIQISKDKFVQYVYNPDYLENEKRYISDTAVVWKNLGFNAELKKLNWF